MIPQRVPFDLAAYTRRIQSTPCFICELVAGNPQFRHHVLWEDDHAIAFLNKYPTLTGYILVAPKQHLEQVTGDFTAAAYAALQAVVYRVAEAVRRTVPTERLYILSLGSQQGNSHVHWHVAALPPGVPLAQQQLAALNMEAGIVAQSEEAMAELAGRLRAALGELREPEDAGTPLGAIVGRLATVDDLDFLARHGNLPRADHRRLIEAGQVIMAEAAGEPAGLLQLEYLWSRVPYIALISVAPDRRGQGVGRALLAHAEALLRARGHRALYSSSQADEPAPQAWHRHVGFEECGFIGGINDGVGEVFFRKWLR